MFSPKKRGLVEKWIRPKNVELCKYHATINVKMNIYTLNTHIWQSNRIHVLNKADQENICVTSSQYALILKTS